MILKAHSRHSGWVYIDGIISLNSKKAYYEEVEVTDGPSPRGQFVIDERVLDESRDCTTCTIFSPNEVHCTPRITWSYPALELNLGGGKFRNIIISEGFLLNNEGKTIDKFEFTCPPPTFTD